jgi:anti-sigma B factor antagonist
MPVADFRIAIHDLPADARQVMLSGDVDARAAPELKDCLLGLFERGHNRIVVDLSDASFLDSTALGVLLDTARQLRQRRGRLVVFCPHPHMRELFELVGHNMIFPVEETLEKAQRHLGGRRRFARSQDRPARS